MVLVMFMNRSGIYLCLLLVLSISFANSMNITGTVDNSGVTSLTIKSDFSHSRNQMVYLNFSAPIQQVTVTDRSGYKLNSTIVQQGNNTLIYVTVPVDYLQFIITTDSLTTKSDSLWDFNLGLATSYNISTISASLILPKGSLIKSSNGGVSGSSNSLNILWQGYNLDPSHKLGLRASYILSDATFDPTFLIEGVVAAIVIIILLFLLSRYLAKNKSANRPEAAESIIAPSTNALDSNDVFKTLDEVDKQIVREIYLQKGKTTQAYLYLNTHIAKATLSRRIASLSAKGIIVKSQKGNRNLITLGEMFKK